MGMQLLFSLQLQIKHTKDNLKYKYKEYKLSYVKVIS